MNLAFTYTRSTLGIEAKPVHVEVHLSNGLPKFTIVGLAETAIKESKDRVRSAIINSYFEFPRRNITVNLAPANLPKTGCGFDLPIAIGILAASGQIPADQLNQIEFIGELALSGNIRGVSCIIPSVLATKRDNRQLILAAANADEAALAGYSQVYSASSLREVCSYLCKKSLLNPVPTCTAVPKPNNNLDWSEVKGQVHAKQAMIIAASGGHSVLLNGPPGSGKTMLARRFNTLLPPLSEIEALECAAIHSILGKTPDLSTWRNPPFRAPHHTASPAALVGGGNPPKPGEITLAHQGVLFLDELPEFNKQVLETLREPLETGSVCISRASIQTEFPAQFQLIAAMNPCPCGHWGNLQENCLCSPDRINRYLGKLSAPFLDRIDMQITVQTLSQEELLKSKASPDDESSVIREQVTAIRTMQFDRQGCLNAALGVKDCEKICELGVEEQFFLAQALNKLKLSARAYHRLLKVARTITDMKGHGAVDVKALQQALAFKQALQGPR